MKRQRETCVVGVSVCLERDKKGFRRRKWWVDADRGWSRVGHERD